MRVAGQFTDHERRRFKCYSHVQVAQQRGLDVGPVAVAALSNMVVTSNARQAMSSSTLSTPPLHECFFDVDVAAAASLLDVHPSLDIILYTFKSYLVLDGAIVGWAQSSPFTITVDAPDAMIPPSSVTIGSEPVLSLFAFCDCTGRFFSSNYLRTNKSCGRKEMRCFPHCCPQHMPHNSCNVPLHVRLHSADSQLSLVARVELLTSTLRIGDVVSVEAIQHDTNWITGSEVAHDDTGAIYVFRATQQLGDRHVMMGWPYDWASTSSHASREHLHVWTAYALAIGGNHEGMPTTKMQVVGVLTSPAFTVVSYRRRRKNEN
ncbi:hypothetical protein H257_08479 [Aphanomyces astaci]|uniref:Uncharacterized protein n=1 Tax=Aphanomyces astaci TaxID=112090 RepID=W4GF31_APHAT|nr:hypothetical protein H257_08479 [Aphanomyces astaci]ETV77548.1 hypothetical protein H257_08479 [Aphanomyces astaci]|eukprot:XP_009832658.1 hypothetical protein H257_08479 [Aphanomyces astaci]